MNHSYYQLILLQCDDGTGLHLNVPRNDISAITARPVKFLRYIAFCILGCDGKIRGSSREDVFLDDEEIPVGERVYFVPDEALQTSAFVDPLARRPRRPSEFTGVHTEPSRSRQRDFREAVISRDGSGLITSEFVDGCEAAHIIPYRHGHTYISTLSSHRPKGADEDDIDDIQDVRNGILLNATDARTALFISSLVVIRTPNAILEHDDVVSYENSIVRNHYMRDGDDPQDGYTSLIFLWLKAEGSPRPLFFDENTPSTNPRDRYPTGSRHRYGPLYPAFPSLPAGYLLDYMFGAICIHMWGVQDAEGQLSSYMKNMYRPDPEDSDEEEQSLLGDEPRPRRAAELARALIERQRQSNDIENDSLEAIMDDHVGDESGGELGKMQGKVLEAMDIVLGLRCLNERVQQHMHQVQLNDQAEEDLRQERTSFWVEGARMVV